MNDPGIEGLRILLVEDEFMIADDMLHELESLGVEVLGPFPTLARAMAFIKVEPSIDAAVLDINLHGEMVWPAADELLARSVPVIFATGYDARVVPPAYAHLPRCEKPVSASRIVDALRNSAGWRG
jgi:DNA-binding LytR/AlgR family response regulator